jgi:hypothetical protein
MTNFLRRGAGTRTSNPLAPFFDVVFWFRYVGFLAGLLTAAALEKVVG